MSDTEKAMPAISTAGAVGTGLGRLTRAAVRSVRSVTRQDVERVAGAAGASAGQAVHNVANERNRRAAKGFFSSCGILWGNLKHVTSLLFLEVTGMLFLFFALGIGAKAWSEYDEFKHGAHNVQRAELAAALAVMFLYFGLSSFWRSRRKARR